LNSTNSKNKNIKSPPFLLVYCGLECTACPIHMATIEEYPSLQTKLKWRQMNNEY